MDFLIVLLQNGGEHTFFAIAMLCYMFWSRFATT